MLSHGCSRSDSELMEALKAGQAAALGVLYDRYAGLVYGIALKILANTTEAEDVTQEVFVSLWRNPTQDEGRWGSLSSFLCGFTRSQALDRLHGRGGKPRLGECCQLRVSPKTLTPPPFERISIEERRQAVQNALSQLPDQQRQILELLYYQGWSQGEISRELGIPLETVKTRSRQALFKLRRSLAPLLP